DSSSAYCNQSCIPSSPFRAEVPPRPARRAAEYSSWDFARIHAAAAMVLFSWSRPGLADRDLIAPRLLVLVEGAIGTLQPGGWRIVRGELGESQRHGELQSVFAGTDAQPAHRTQEALGQGCSVAHPRIREDDRELFAPVTGHEVGFAQEAARETVGERLQDAVAGRMAILIVDPLEVIDVDHEQDRRLPEQPAQANDVREMVVESAAVEEPGQRIDRAFAARLLELVPERRDPRSKLAHLHLLALLALLD